MKFNVDLKKAFAHEKAKSYVKYDELFTKVLNSHAPLKKKILRANYSSYISTTLRKEIMRKSCLEKNYLKKRTEPTNLQNLLEPTKSRKVIAVDFIKVGMYLYNSAYNLNCRNIFKW